MTTVRQTVLVARQHTQHTVLTGVSWQTYQALLKDLGDQRSSRLVYDQGILEIIMPSSFHEMLNRLLALLITVLTDELDMKIRNAGSTTLDREDLERGVEPDSCFYIQNFERIRGRLNLDMASDPAPDLAVEVDINSSSRRRFGIYRELGIPEVWRYTKQHGVVIYQLQVDEFQVSQYVECEFSPTFPMVSGAIVMQFLQLLGTEDDNALVRSFRQWLKIQVTQ